MVVVDTYPLRLLLCLVTVFVVMYFHVTFYNEKVRIGCEEVEVLVTHVRAAPAALSMSGVCDDVFHVTFHYDVDQCLDLQSGESKSKCHNCEEVFF